MKKIFKKEIIKIDINDMADPQKEINVLLSSLEYEMKFPEAYKKEMRNKKLKTILNEKPF